MAELVDAQDLGSCVFDVGVRVPSRPLMFVTRRFCYTRYAREIWWRAGLLVAEMGSRSVFLSGQAAKKNYEHPYAPSRSPSTTALAMNPCILSVLHE